MAGAGPASEAAAERSDVAPGRPPARMPTGLGERVASAGRALLSRRGRWVRSGIVAVLAFALGYLLAARWLFPASDARVAAELVPVPDLVGTAVESAESRLRDAGLVARVGAELNHPEEEEGSVLAQSPLPGGMAVEGDTVRLTVSLGRRTASVPPLRGLAEPEAVAVLERLGFTVTSRSVQAPSPGVQETEPNAGALVTLPAEVEVRVGEAARVVEVPDLRGMHIEDVEQLLEEAGLQLGSLQYDEAAAQAPGRVVAQSPPAGYSLRAGGFVSVEVAGRPEGG